MTRKPNSATTPTHRAQNTLSMTLIAPHLPGKGAVSIVAKPSANAPRLPDYQVGAAEQKCDAEQAARRQGRLLEPKESDPVEEDRGRELSGDGGGRDRA